LHRCIQLLLVLALPYITLSLTLSVLLL
jgi:hypothetical protein